VAILNQENTGNASIDKNDLEISWFSGTGPGGQNRNKVQASCRLKHIPSGIIATAQTRSRSNSYEQAYESLKKRLEENTHMIKQNNLRNMIKSQVGSGQRGDKIRTIQFQHNVATDHRTGKKITAEEYMQGYMDRLWYKA
jgi:peptide chain release factor 1